MKLAFYNPEKFNDNVSYWNYFIKIPIKNTDKSYIVFKSKIHDPDSWVMNNPVHCRGFPELLDLNLDSELDMFLKSKLVKPLPSYYNHVFNMIKLIGLQFKNFYHKIINAFMQ